jgi:type IV pilus assembly protein PilE
MPTHSAFAVSCLAPPESGGRQRGFTLIEVMLVVVIVGILSAIALPSYAEYVRRAARADVQLTLLQASSWLERRYAECNSYTRINPSTNPPCTTVLAASDLPASLKVSPSGGGSVRYNVTISALEGQAYTVQGVPLDATDRCGTFQFTSAGVRSADGPLGTAACWQR